MTAPALDEICARITRGNQLFYFEISPLFERAWTGIPMVTAGLARGLLSCLRERVQFCYGRREVPAALVADVLARGGGSRLLQAWEGAGHAWPTVTDQRARLACALFPSVKPVRHRFAIEASLFHDISTIITPQFHQTENIRHHAATLLQDRASNAVSFTVSQATADDLAAYFGDDGRTFVVGNGFAWPADFATRAARLAAPFAGERYFLVLGTLEPRKNLACLFEALRRFPALLDVARFVIAGKPGQHIVEADPLIRQAIAAGKIVYTGYISQFRKYCLLRHAAATIYPSMFEGFGLPVLESLSLGTACIASFSAAIPEAGGAFCYYFDPFSADSLYAAIKAALQADQADSATAARRRAFAESRSWAVMLARMLDRLGNLIAS